MKSLKTLGISIFLLALGIFTITPFIGTFNMSEEVMLNNLSEQELGSLEEDFRTQIVDKDFGSSATFHGPS